jgi:hypothetical protein
MGIDTPYFTIDCYPVKPSPDRPDRDSGRQIPGNRATSLSARPPRSGLEIEKGLLVTGSGEEVVQISINLIPVRIMPGVTEFMIGNHRNPGFKELG